MPQTIHQGKELLKIMANSSADQLERFKAWMILHHFMLVSQSFALSQCNCMIVWMNMFGPVNPHAPLGTLNVRILTPDPSLGLVIDPWVQYILHCGHPGMLNKYYGITFDQSFCILWHSMWGYLLE